MGSLHENPAVYLPNLAFPPSASQSDANLLQEQSSSRPRLLQLLNSTFFLRMIGLALHILLVLFHIVLLVVTFRNIEKRATIPIGPKTDTLSVVVPALSQLVWVIYLAGMLVITQALALHVTLQKLQSLTATHDVMYAWTGFGAASLSLFNQARLPSSIIEVLNVFVYLFAVQVLHVTAPALITLVSTTVNVTSTTDVIKGVPQLTTSDTGTLALDLLVGGYPSWSRAANLLPTFGPPGQRSLSTPGLIGNVLYDVPISSGTTGLVDVETSTVGVTCGTVDEARHIGQKSNHVYTVGAQHGNYSFNFDVGFNESMVDFDNFRSTDFVPIFYRTADDNFTNSGSAYTSCDDTFSKVPCDDFTEIRAPDFFSNYSDAAPDLTFWTFANVTDDNNTNKSWIPFIIPFPLDEKYGDGGTTGTGVSFVACSFSFEKGRGLYNTASGELLDTIKQNRTSNWDVLSLKDESSESGAIAALAAIKTIVSHHAITDTQAFPQFIEGHTRLPFDLYSQTWIEATSPTLFRLSQIEDAIANASAGIIWTSGFLETVGQNNAGGSLVSNNVSRASSYDEVNALRLNINRLPLIVGLISSLTLCLIFATLSGARSSGRESQQVKGAGLLHILWLFSGTIGQHIVSNVRDEDASTENLRRAGVATTTSASLSRSQTASSGRTLSSFGEKIA